MRNDPREPQRSSETATPDVHVGDASAPRWPEPVTLDREAMGTRLHMLAYPSAHLSLDKIRSAFAAAEVRMSELASTLSSWTEGSIPSQVNRKAGSWVSVDPDTAAIMKLAIEIGERSGGAFDITHQTLAHLWRFGSAQPIHPVPPRVAEVAPLLTHVGMNKIDLEVSRVRVARGTKIGLDGIAKGYIVDQAVLTLRRAGLEDFLVQAGGDLFASGVKPDGSSWQSGIRDPRGKENEFFARLQIRDQAFSTAGDYARFYIHEGTRYHHILDPKTGFPAKRCRSVTLLAPSAFLADALDDAVFVLGPEKGLALLAEFEDVGAVIVDSDNQLHMSPNLQKKLEILAPPTQGL
jgi:thiamine biosynthesis lipoprotein